MSSCNPSQELTEVGQYLLIEEDGQQKIKIKLEDGVKKFSVTFTDITDGPERVGILDSSDKKVISLFRKFQEKFQGKFQEKFQGKFQGKLVNICNISGGAKKKRKSRKRKRSLRKRSKNRKSRRRNKTRGGSQQDVLNEYFNGVNEDYIKSFKGNIGVLIEDLKTKIKNQPGKCGSIVLPEAESIQNTKELLKYILSQCVH